jgi:osmotically-inducible protein OsmY
MRTLLRLLFAVAVIVGALWLFQQRALEQVTREAKAEVGSAVRGAKEAVEELDAQAIAEELKRTEQVVRRKTTRAVRTVAEATEDARTTASIKARLALDPQLSALEISVDTTDGRVTLAGRVDSAEHVARAIRLALEEDSVHEVISTLQVRAADRRRKVSLAR